MDPVMQAILAALTGNLLQGLGGENTQQIPAPVGGGAPPTAGPLAAQAQFPDSTRSAAFPFGLGQGLDVSGLDVTPPNISPQATTGLEPIPLPEQAVRQPGGLGEEEVEDDFLGDVLAALPEAIAGASHLLGLDQPDPRFAPVAGHATNPGQLVQGFNLPQGMNLGQLLSALPQVHTRSLRF